MYNLMFTSYIFITVGLALFLMLCVLKEIDLMIDGLIGLLICNFIYVRFSNLLITC